VTSSRAGGWVFHYTFRITFLNDSSFLICMVDQGDNRLLLDLFKRSNEIQDKFSEVLLRENGVLVETNAESMNLLTELLLIVQEDLKNYSFLTRNCMMSDVDVRRREWALEKVRIRHEYVSSLMGENQKILVALQGIKEELGALKKQAGRM